MCDPTVIAITALAAGTGLQYKAQQDRNSDMRKLNRRENERQKGYYADSKKYLDENQSTYSKENVDANMAEAAAARQAEYAAADRQAPRANEALPGATSGNSVVADAFARALQGAQQEATQRGAARAELASFGDTMVDNALTTGRNSNYIGMNGSFAQGSANALLPELQHAATKTRGAATIGNLLTTIGGAMLGGAGAGLFGGVGSAAGAGAGTGSFLSGGMNSLVGAANGGAGVAAGLGSKLSKGAGLFSGLGGGG